LGGSTQAGNTATAFGLDVRSEIALPFLGVSSGRTSGRTLDVSVHPGDATALGWPESAELVADERQADGSVSFQIFSHPDAGYLIFGPRYGSHRLSADGRRLQCAPGNSDAVTWQRLLIAQILPFAALLQGLEVFHASAVVRDGRALALLGGSGSGKTSLALELCRRGSSFLADDVLSLELFDGKLLAYPGAQVAGVDRADIERPAEREVDSSEEILAVTASELLIGMRGITRPVPLGGLYFIDRRMDGPEQPSFQAAGDPRALLAATFNFVLVSPERLLGLLNVCAVAAQLPVERILFGPRAGIAELGAALERRLSSRE
jgi:hypothetical protein